MIRLTTRGDSFFLDNTAHGRVLISREKALIFSYSFLAINIRVCGKSTLKENNKLNINNGKEMVRQKGLVCKFQTNQA